MGKRICCVLIVLGLLSYLPRSVAGGGQHGDLKASFQTSDRCLACHNGILTPSGEDVSIGFDWRASMMGNSSRDPYWQASVRRDTIDHTPAAAETEDESSVCR